MTHIAALTTCILAVTVTSCNKKDDNPTCTAGSGGNVSIVVFAKHAGNTIINTEQHPDTAYVKYGATTSPGTNPALYDTYYVSEEGEDHIHLTNLKCGNYYVYRTAFDSTTTPGTRYTGGTAVSFTKTSGEVDVDIDVN